MSDPVTPPTRASRGTILVTPRSVTRDGHPSLVRLEQAGYKVAMSPAGRQPAEDELLALLPGCVGYLAGVEPVDARVLEAGARGGLRAISRNGTGVDNIDLDAARRLGIRIERAAGANARGVAELAWGLALGLARAIPASDAALKRQKWERERGIELAGRTLGLVGCGTIGRMVAGFGGAFGMQVVAFDPAPDAAFARSAGPAFRFASLEDVLEVSDVVSLHCPPMEGGALIDARRLAAMRRGTLLINTARAELIDDAAVLGSLESGLLAGYAADVFRSEPPVGDLLVRHPRVIATPHVGGFTGESVDRAMGEAVDRLLRALDEAGCPVPGQD